MTWNGLIKVDKINDWLKTKCEKIGQYGHQDARGIVRRHEIETVCISITFLW